ncbi:MAG: YifB family Mg chelatase-like AAA ATPase [Spirochaeta sp.]|jgi:magnesium chelatase family protein|nr:YifB family Mg chelatase-like AAA ATPase [Spirochaeta sp.]
MVYGFSPVGVMGHLVRVEVDIRRGLPGTDIVGLPSSEVKEARERVRVAIRNSGYTYPTDRILINLSPAEIPKVGAGFDLPMALAILSASGQITVPDTMIAVGELSIRGDAIPVRGTLSAVLAAQEHSISPVVVPVRAVRYLRGIRVETAAIFTVGDLRRLRTAGFIPVRKIPPRKDAPSDFLNFDEMRGQLGMKWAAAISAAGCHNLLYMGPPGSGKTMAARRIGSLLPDLSDAETQEVARIYSMRGIVGNHPGVRPPVRLPHHSATMEGMLGGGRSNLPGEVSLAHHGVLVLDEATEFRPQVMQALREPVEAGRITISRAGRTEDFPSSFQLVLTSNLCPCGKLGQPGETCMCSTQEMARYWRRLGAALLDRVDIRLRSYYNEGKESGSRRDDFGQPSAVRNMTHAELVQHVSAAVERQKRRSGGATGFRNGQVPPGAVERCLPLSRGMEALLRRRMQQLHLSDRAAAGVRGVARTVADLHDRSDVKAGDVLEAVQLRAFGLESLA